MKTFLQYIFEDQVKRDDFNSDVYTKNREKNAVNNKMIKYGTEEFLSDPLGIKRKMQRVVDRVTFYQWKKERDRQRWIEQLPHDRDGNILG